MAVLVPAYQGGQREWAGAGNREADSGLLNLLTPRKGTLQETEVQQDVAVTTLQFLS